MFRAIRGGRLGEFDARDRPRFIVLARLSSGPSSSTRGLLEDRQLVVTEGADYFGADYDVRKDVDLDQCKAACTGDDKCQAFTYNTAARWCFLKSDVGELRAVEGAVSGKIVAARGGGQEAARRRG